MNQPKIIEVIEDLPDHEYHARDELSSHDLKMFLDDPFLFYRTKVVQDLKIQESRTPEIMFGTKLHEILEHHGDWQRFVCVEPEGFEEHSFKREFLESLDKVVEVPDEVLKDGHRRGKPYLDWKKEQAEDAIIADADFSRPLYEKYKSFLGDSEGKEIIKAGKVNRYREIIETAMKNKWLRERIESEVADRELTIIWEHETGIKCRSRIDYLSNLMLDWKTILHLSKDTQAILSFKYDFSAAFYRQAVWGLEGQIVPFYWVFLHKNPGFGFKVVDAELWMEHATKGVNTAMEALARFDWDDLFNRPIVNSQPPAWRDNIIEVEE